MHPEPVCTLNMSGRIERAAIARLYLEELTRPGTRMGYIGLKVYIRPRIVLELLKCCLPKMSSTDRDSQIPDDGTQLVCRVPRVFIMNKIHPIGS